MFPEKGGTHANRNLEILSHYARVGTNMGRIPAGAHQHGVDILHRPTIGRLDSHPRHRCNDVEHNF